jgi:peptide deformylase
MLLKIVQAGEPVLRQRARALTGEEIAGARIQQLIELMRATMHDAPGVGLAAPQVGESLQLAVLEDRTEAMQNLSAQVLSERERQPVPFQVIINPTIVLTDPTPLTFFEGCLSVAGFLALVPRARAVRVKCLNERAEPVVIEARGWYARILQHEIDHLHGRLCIDCMERRSFMSADNYFRHWQDKPLAEVRTVLGIDGLNYCLL